MEYSVVIILLALLQYLFFALRTGVTRVKYKVDPPKTAGHEIWERYSRVHLNTGEQLIAFIPALLTFTYYVSHRWAIVLGVGYLIARQVYSFTYIKNPKRRVFPPTFFINVALIIGSLIGIVISIIKTGT
jgi:glutathione S-transferase